MTQFLRNPLYWLAQIIELYTYWPRPLRRKMTEAGQALQPEREAGSGADDAVGVDGLLLLKLPHRGVGVRAESAIHNEIRSVCREGLLKRTDVVACHRRGCQT